MSMRSILLIVRIAGLTFILPMLLMAAACAPAGTSAGVDGRSATPPVAHETANARPLVGITSDYNGASNPLNATASVSMSYVNAVLEAGGTPVILPPILSDEARAHYLRRLDALVLIGGRDIPPAIYGQAQRPETELLASQRFEAESRLIKAWMETDKPILGICLGAQFTNVMGGGSLIQHIPAQVPDALNHRGGQNAHEVTLAEGSRLRGILKADKLTVNSYHHQAVDRVSPALKVVARAPDGVVEALEIPSARFGLFLQWHPERMDAAHRNAIFSALLKAASDASGQPAISP